MGGNAPTIDLTVLEGSPEGGLAERVALALGSTLELQEILAALAALGREAAGANRASIFLLEGRRLFPAVAIGVEPDAALWDAFREMGPIDLDDARWEALGTGRVMSFADARHTDGFVPGEWVERFTVGALALVPLTSRQEPVGLMALDWVRRQSVPPDDLAVLEAIGTYAGLAVANARLYESLQARSHLQETLAAAAAALSGVLEAQELAGGLADAYVDLVGAPYCGVGLFDADRSRILRVAVKGAREVEIPLARDDIPDDLVRRVWDEWEGTKAPLEFRDDPFFDETLGGREAGAAWYLLLPLVVETHARGVVLLGFDARTRLGAHERGAVDALARLASTALERRILLDRLHCRYGQLETLFHVSAALTNGADAANLVTEANALLLGHGIEVTGVALRDRRLARHLGGDCPTDEERAAWRGGRWRLGEEWARLPSGDRAAPMRLGRRLVGTLRVAYAELGSEDRAFVEALARGLAEVAERDVLRRAMEQAGREQVVAAERDRMAGDLHDTAGSALVAIGLSARQHAGGLTAGSATRDVMLRLAALADEGKWEIDQAVRALAFLPAAARGLTPSLNALARSFSSDSGIEATVEIAGRPSRLKADVERALYRVGHEALVNAWRHAECRRVEIDLVFGDDAVVLRVVDDGVGLGDGLPEERVGMAGMRRAVRDIGGELTVQGAEPRGTLIEARVTRRSR